MECDRDGCPGERERIGAETLRREERAHERGDHEAHAEWLDERRERLREFDRAVFE